MRRRFAGLAAATSGVLAFGFAALAGAPAARADELVSPEKITNLTWAYALSSKWLKLKACGRFRPGENEQCAEVKLLNTMTTGRSIDRALQMLRVPRDKLGIVMKSAGGKFEIVALVAELLSAPGIGERPARPPTVEWSGESLSQVLFIQSLMTRAVTVKVCGKVANPDRSGCAELVEETPDGVRRLRDLLLLNPIPVEQLGFFVGWDGSKFTKLRRIASPSTN